MATGRPLLTGTSESDQLARIFRQMGTPTPAMYPGLQELPDYRVSNLLSRMQCTVIGVLKAWVEMPGGTDIPYPLAFSFRNLVSRYI